MDTTLTLTDEQKRQNASRAAAQNTNRAAGRACYCASPFAPSDFVCAFCTGEIEAGSPDWREQIARQSQGY